MSASEMVAVSTSFNVRRWDADQVAWTRSRLLSQLGIRLAGDPDHTHFARLGVAPYSETQDDNCNNLTQGGWLGLLTGWSASGTALTSVFNATHGRIGIGTSTGAFSWTMTTLIGDTGAASTTSYFKLISATPTIASGSSPMTMQFVAAFGGTVANFSWQEFGTDAGTADSVSNATTGGTFVNRGVSNQGTKTAGQVWTATETISFGFASVVT